MAGDVTCDGDDLVLRNGKLRLRRERVIDSDDCHARPCRVLAHQAVVRVEAPERPPAAVEIDECRFHASRFGIVDADARGDRSLRDRRDGRSAAAPLRADFLRDLSHLRERHRGEIAMRRPCGAHFVDETLDVGIELNRWLRIGIALSR